MENPKIITSAPRPPKQIRVEENPELTNVKSQDLPAQKPEQPAQPEEPSKITVMHPTVSKDAVVKLNTEKPEASIDNNDKTEAAGENLPPVEENIKKENEEDVFAQVPDVERNSTEEQLELGEIEITDEEVLPQNETVENKAVIEDAEAAQMPDPEKDTTEEQMELAEVDAEASDKPIEEDQVSDEQQMPEAEIKVEETAGDLKQEETSENFKATAGAKTMPEKTSKPSKKIDTEVGFESLKVPGDDELFQRQYYTMGEVATMFHANQSQIRFWENEFDILQPKKNKKGDRYFRPEDIKNLQTIHYLLRNKRFTIEGAREYLKSNKQRAQDTVAAITSLEQIKSFLTELKASL